MKQTWYDLYQSLVKDVYNKFIFLKQSWTEQQVIYLSQDYYQSYSVSIYSSHGEWPSQEYNSYWENKMQQQNSSQSTHQNLHNQSSQLTLKSTGQLQLPAPKQSLMITARAVAATQPHPSYPYGRGTNYNTWGQGWYECVTGGWP